MIPKYKLLTSATHDRNSTRSYCEFENKEELAKRLIGYFEEYLIESNTTSEAAAQNASLEYISDDLFEFLDTFFGELVCLERDDDQPDLWTPYTSDWVKEVVYMYLKSLSDSGAESPKENGVKDQAMEIDLYSY